MTVRNTMMMGLVSLALSLGACDKGDAGGDKGKTAAKGKTDAKGKPDAKGEGDAKADAKADAKPDAEDEAKPEPLDERVVKAAALAKKIEADPEQAETIIEAAGMDRAAFNDLIYEVSKGDLAEQYRLAMAREG